MMYRNLVLAGMVASFEVFGVSPFPDPCTAVIRKGLKIPTVFLPPKMANPVARARQYLRVNRNGPPRHFFYQGALEQMRNSSFSREDVLNAVDEGFHNPAMDYRRRNTNAWYYAIEGPNLDETKSIRAFVSFGKRDHLFIPFVESASRRQVIGHLRSNRSQVISDKFRDISSMGARRVREGKVFWGSYASALMTERNLSREEILNALRGKIEHRQQEDYFFRGDWFYSIRAKLPHAQRVRLLVNVDVNENQRGLYIKAVYWEDEGLNLPRGAQKFLPYAQLKPHPLEDARTFVTHHGLGGANFSPHAVERMEERRITDADILHLILWGVHNRGVDIYSWGSGRHGRWRYAIDGQSRGRPLRVIIAFDESDRLQVVTIMHRTAG